MSDYKFKFLVTEKQQKPPKNAYSEVKTFIYFSYRSGKRAILKVVQP